jgi:hypothetical protein
MPDLEALPMKRRVCLDRFLVAFLVVWVGSVPLGCLKPRVVVEIDEPSHTGWGERSPTWNWAPGATTWFEAPEIESAGVQPRLKAFVSRALTARGFVHTHEQPDVHLRYRLAVRRTMIVTHEPVAAQTITGSLVQGHYEIHGVVRVEHEFDDLRLEVHVSRADDGQPLWVASFREHLRERFEPHLEGAVARVFESFPQAPSTSAAVDSGPDSQ